MPIKKAQKLPFCLKTAHFPPILAKKCKKICIITNFFVILLVFGVRVHMRITHAHKTLANCQTDKTDKAKNNKNDNSDNNVNSVNSVKNDNNSIIWRKRKMK